MDADVIQFALIKRGEVKEGFQFGPNAGYFCVGSCEAVGAEGVCDCDYVEMFVEAFEC